MLTTNKNHLILMSASTLLALFSLAAILEFTDPDASGATTHIFFYISLFLALLGVVTLLGALIRKILGKGGQPSALSDSFRQALLIAALVVCSFLLQAQGLLFWWVEITLILFVTCLEAFINLKT